jgi:hypothetical protein
MSFESSAYIPTGTFDTTGRYTPTTAQQHASLIAEIERLQGLLADANTETERLFFVSADALNRENAAKAGREIEQEMIRNAVAQLSEKDDTIRRVKMELDHWRMRATEDRNAMAKMASPEMVGTLIEQRDEARAHVADARRIIEAVLRLCDTWERSSDSNVAYAIRETMAIAGSGTRPTGDCGCGRHNSNHSHCYAGCDLSGCRMLGGSEHDYE